MFPLIILGGLAVLIIAATAEIEKKNVEADDGE